MTDRLGRGVVACSSRGPCELTAKPLSSWGGPSRNRHQVVATRRGSHERLSQAGLELIEPPPQRQERRMDCGERRSGAKEPGFDQVARGGGLRALGEVHHQRGLLLSQLDLSRAGLDGAAGGGELALAAGGCT